MNPFFGVFFHWLGGFAAGSFYIPYLRVKGWAWETMWLTGGFFSWILAPLFFAYWLVPDFFSSISFATWKCLGWTFFWGLLWGVGGLTFGLTMRYLGMSLGMAVALGFCAAFGTLLPPIFHGTFTSEIASLSGKIIVSGVVLCLLGICCSGYAGVCKEREMSDEQKQAAIKEFNLSKGLIVATFCGLMSSCFAFAIDAGTPISNHTKELLEANQKSTYWQGLPKLVVVLWGGFTTNFIWCLYLNLKNGSLGQYLSSRPIVSKVGGNYSEMAAHSHVEGGEPKLQKVPLIRNYFWCSLAGVTWYFQFFFYTMGETQMGSYGFASWTLHMASIIIFSTFWGIMFKEWKGAGIRSKKWLALGLLILICSTVVIGYGTFLKGGSVGGH